MKRSELFNTLLDEIRESNRSLCSLNPLTAFYVGLSLRSVFHSLYDCRCSEYLILNSHIINSSQTSFSFVGPLPQVVQL